MAGRRHLNWTEQVAGGVRNRPPQNKLKHDSASHLDLTRCFAPVGLTGCTFSTLSVRCFVARATSGRTKHRHSPGAHVLRGTRLGGIYLFGTGLAPVALNIAPFWTLATGGVLTSAGIGNALNC